MTNADKIDFISTLNRDSVNDTINEVTEEFINKNDIESSRFEKQIEYAKKIIFAYSDGFRYVILEAPTGFGKSLLALFISEIVNRLHKKYYKESESLNNHKQTYILTSSKQLQNQYFGDINKFSFHNRMISLKGQSNYICSKNGSPFTERECVDLSLNNISNNSTFTKCSSSCKYLIDRKKAIKFDNTILNYSYFLTSMNKVFRFSEEAPFKPRLLTIMDEAHTLPNIVQNMFGVDYNSESFIKFTNSIYKSQAQFYDSKHIEFENGLKNLMNASNELSGLSDTIDYQGIFNALEWLKTALNDISKEFTNIFNIFTSDSDGNEVILTDDQRRFKAQMERTINLHDSIDDLITVYGDVGVDSIVLSKDFINDMNVLKLQCTDEVHLVKTKALSFIGYGLFMSATIGDMDKFAKQLGIEDGDYITISIDSDFDFKDSEIFHVSPALKMGYKDQAANMPYMLTYINKILDFHKNERGIIHTGNFAFTKALEGLNSRLLFYRTAEEKAIMLNRLNRTKDGVICGPSLLEGIDLKDDLSRFQIFMKVPFPSLADKLVKSKMTKYPGWYDWITTLQVLQGIGRSIRHKTDHAKTYLLDGNFNNFLMKNKLPKFISDRIKTTDINNIGEDLTKKLDDLFKNF